MKRNQIKKNREFYKTNRMKLDHPCASNLDFSDKCTNFEFENDYYELSQSEEEIKNNVDF